MESSGEGGLLGLGFMEIETNAENLDGSTVFHIVKEVLGFVLYMHHQIPSVLQNLELEFDDLKQECKKLESTTTEAESNTTSRRKHNGRIREVKQGIRRLEKLMNGITSLLSALQYMLTETPNIQRVVLVLGASLVRPQHVYEMFFPHGRFVSKNENDCSKSKAAEALSRKAIRALISNGAGASSYAACWPFYNVKECVVQGGKRARQFWSIPNPLDVVLGELRRKGLLFHYGSDFFSMATMIRGPAKLFLLVKAPVASNLADHFLPRRDFRYSKKILPFRLHIKCRIRDQYMDESHPSSQPGNLIDLLGSSSTDMIWFQCRHTIKGLASKASLAEE